MGKGKDLRQRKRRSKEELANDSKKLSSGKTGSGAREAMAKYSTMWAERKATPSSESSTVAQADERRQRPRDERAGESSAPPLAPETNSDASPRQAPMADESAVPAPDCQQSGLPAVDQTVYVTLISGNEPKEIPGLLPGEQLKDWIIMYRDGAYRWRKGTVRGPGENNPDHCIVLFGAVAEEIDLAYDSYCDGSSITSEVCPWFRIRSRADHQLFQMQEYNEERDAMMKRSKRELKKEVGDGHCGFSALARQKFRARQKITPALIYQARTLVAAALRKNVDHVVRLISRFQNDAETTAEIRTKLLARARNINLSLQDCSKGCATDYFFGGPYWADPIAVAFEEKIDIYVVQSGRTSVTKCDSDGFQTIPLGEVAPKSSDIVLLYDDDREHFDSYVSEDLTRDDSDLAENEPFDDESDEEEDDEATVDLTDPAQPEDDPIQGVDDATDEKLEYFNEVVKPLREALHRTGNWYNKQAQGKWPWRDMWHHPPDPATLPIIDADDYKRVQWGRLFVFLPEFIYPRAYPDGRPPCKWHGCSGDCVVANNFLNPAGPRLVMDSDSVFFVWSGTYVCSKRRDAGERPYCFNGYDADSMKYLPRFIRSKFPAITDTPSCYFRQSYRSDGGTRHEKVPLLCFSSFASRTSLIAPRCARSRLRL